MEKLVSVDTPFDATAQTGHQFAKVMEASGAQVVTEILPYAYPPQEQDRLRTAGFSFDLRIAVTDPLVLGRLFVWLGAYVRHPDQAAMSWAIDYSPPKAFEKASKPFLACVAAPTCA